MLCLYFTHLKAFSNVFWLTGYLGVLLNFHVFLSFSNFCQFLVSIHCGSKIHFVLVTLILLNLSKFCSLACGLSWTMLSVHLGRIYILLLGVTSIDVRFFSVFFFLIKAVSLLIFCLVDQSIIASGILNLWILLNCLFLYCQFLLHVF